MSFILDTAYEQWLLIWKSLLELVEPHLPEYLHWNELCWNFVFYLNEVRLMIHQNTRGLEHWEIVVNTITVCFYVFLFVELLRWTIPFIFFNRDGFFNVMKKGTFRVLRRMPFVKGKIQKSVDTAISELQNDLFDLQGQDYLNQLPKTGMSLVNLQEEIKKYKSLGHIEWSAGKVSGVVYAADSELDTLMREVYKEFIWTNPLHADVFPGVRKMEAEVVQMVSNMFHGGDKCCGVMTSGGTESIMMACKAYRDIALEKGITRPEIVAPYSVHPAFDKAAHYLGMKICHIPVDKDGRGDVKAMRKAINKRTIVLVGSVPSYPHGCIDHIEEYSKLALKYNKFLHVDCCLGGFLVAFMGRAGYQLPEFDFNLPGVTSISCDTHKYGYTPKGSSVLLYRNKDIRKYQYFCYPDWSGGIYASASMPGSRSGNIVATTWAALMYHGEKGYVERTRKIIEATRQMANGLEKIEGIKIMSPVDVSVIGFTSDYFDVFIMSAEMTKKNWHLTTLQFPSGIHIAVTMQHTKPGVVDEFVSDVRQIAKQLMKNPSQKAEGKAALYGTSQQIPDRSIINDICYGFLDTYYSCEAGLKS